METCLPPDEHDVEFAEAALDLIDHVAEFEEINRRRLASKSSISPRRH